MPMEFDALPQGWYLGDMTEADLPAVRAVEIASYPFPWSEGIFRDCIHSGYLCKLVRDSDDLIAAYAIVSVAVEECHILNICVNPTKRGNGIARWLLRYMLAQSMDFGARDAFLEVRPSNPIAIRLYQSLGFQQVGKRKNYYPDHQGREDAQVMALPLYKNA